MSATFDTLCYARRLEAGGVPPAQAQAHAGALAEALDARDRNLVTTPVLRTELTALRAELRAEMADLRAELRAEMAELRNELHVAVADARGEFKAIHAELRMMRWLLGLIAAGVATLLARTLF